MTAPDGLTTRLILCPAEARLLLRAARPSLSDAQQALASDLVAQVAQWPAFIDTAHQKFVLPMVYANLSGLRDTPPPDAVLDSMRARSFDTAVASVRRQAAFDGFHRDCVQPSGVAYAYLKGPALAARFYPDPMQRFYRDVDILVAPGQQVRFLRHLCAQGCRIFRHEDPGAGFLDADSDLVLAEFLFATPVVHVLTPQDLVVDLHAEIDEHTALFDTGMLLRTAREVPLERHGIRVLRDAEHFVFICYHHTRHMWSKLHWLADLDAMCNHPEFDRAAVMACARRLGLESTVAAALDLHALAAAARHPSDLDGRTPGGDLLSACVTGLAGDRALEHAMRKTQRLHVIGFDWQPMPVSRARRAWLRLRRFRPSYDDLTASRGARPLRYGVAIARRLARAARNIWDRTRQG